MSIHDTLCQEEACRLEARGFKVIFEKEIILKNGKRYIVDVYAWKDNGVILVECGWCVPNKLRELNTEFKTIHIPYLKCWLPTVPYDPLEGQRWKRYGVV